MATAPAPRDHAGSSSSGGHQVAPHQEDPSVWGWHGEFGRSARVGGWVVLVILLVMITATHYNGQGPLWLVLFAAGLFVVLLWDRRRRKNAWRN